MRKSNHSLRVFLVVSLLYASYAWWSELRAYQPLVAERDELSEHLDPVDIDHRDDVQFFRIETHDPMTFAWRAFHPTETDLATAVFFDGRTRVTSHDRSTIEFFAENQGHSEGLNLPVWVKFSVRRKEDHPDALSVSIKSAPSFEGHHYAVFSDELSMFVQEHWSDLEIQLLEHNGAVESLPEEPLRLLSVRIPKELLTELSNKVDAKALSKIPGGLLFWMGWGEKKALNKAIASELARKP